ncbi:MAG TPA: proprotein convertase P-domain-containing protein, partial [Thermoanaerobaculia bacterium]
VDPRAIERLLVRVDIDHSARGDLFIELTAPDGTKVLLHQLSSSRTPDIHTAFEVDALDGRSAAGTWTLFVADRRPRDSGTLVSWALEIQFAGDAPVTARPSGSPSQMIPVVAHLFGQNGAYVSDVRIANPSASPRTATLIFTRSGEESFAVQRVALDAGQTAALDDVVERTFHTFGSGTLEVQGDVIMMSRVAGQAVPANLDTTAVGEPLLIVAPVPEAATRVNFGLAEVAGGRGIVQVGDREIEIVPFSHVQFPVGTELLDIRVIDGDARVSAYVSQIGGDALFVAAESAVERRGCAPAITSQTSGEPEWQSDVWFASPQAGLLGVDAIPGGSTSAVIPALYRDLLATLFHRTITTSALCATLPANVFASSRIVHGAITEAVPLLPPGPLEQHLLFLENDTMQRTNIGIFSENAATAEVTVYDAAGIELERFGLSTPGGVAQREVRASVTNGRAVVRLTAGNGRAYASVIGDDATFFPGR